MANFVTMLISGLGIGSIYALVAMGFVVIYKCTKILNLAQGELVLIGSYICFSLASFLNLPVGLALVLGALLAAGFGAIVQRLFIQPLIGQPVFSTVVMTLGLGMLLRSIAFAIWGAAPLGTLGMFPASLGEIGGVMIRGSDVGALAVSLGLIAAFLLFFRHSRIGIRMRAVADDEQAAEALKMKVRQLFLVAWALAGATAAVAGTLFGARSIFDVSLVSVGFKCLAVVFLGGLESFSGVLAAGMLIGIVEAMAGLYLAPFLPGCKDVIAYALIVVILIFRPYGFRGQEEIERV